MSYSEFHALSKEELARGYSVLLQNDRGVLALDVEAYREEIDRRVAERQTAWLVRLTWALVVLTVVVAIATLVLVWIELGSH